MPTDDSTSSSGTNERLHESTTSGLQHSLIAGHNIWEWLFLVVGTWNIAILQASSGVALAQCELHHTLLSAEFSTEVVVIVVSIIALGFAVYGVHEEHQYDMYLHIVFAAIADFFSYFAAEKKCHSCLKLVSFYVAVLLTIINSFIAYKATHASDWTEFKIIGASESLAAMYKKQCCFLSLLKFDALFVVICAIYSFPISLDFPNIRNLYLLISLIFMYSFMSWCCGKVTVCKEDKYLASGFIVLCITYPCLLIYQVYMSKTRKMSDENQVFYLHAQFTCAFIIVLCKFLLTLLMIQTCRTFGYGLNTSSMETLKIWLDRPSKKKSKNDKRMWFGFLRECLHLKCTNKTKETDFTYKDIYRF